MGTETSTTQEGVPGEDLREALLTLAADLVNDHRGIPYDVIRRIDEIAAIEAEPAGLDVERLYQAILDELLVLWGEPSDAVSMQVRPLVARGIVERYARSV